MHPIFSLSCVSSRERILEEKIGGDKSSAWKNNQHRLRIRLLARKMANNQRDDKLPSNCNMPSLARAVLAEFVGTFILVAIGSGSVAQSQLTNGKKGDYFTINWGWALGCSLGILVSGKASGGHLNPAVTMALAVAKDFSWKRLPAYWLAQYSGALVASGAVLGIYYEAIAVRKVDGEFRINSNSSEPEPGSAAIFANYPTPYSSVLTGLMEEILSTMIFMLIICVVTNSRYSKVPNFLQPLYIGFTLLAIGVAYGSNGGYALNPARDLAPRLVTYFGGWGPRVFSFRSYNWFWIFLVGPHVGALLGVGIFHAVFLRLEQTAVAADGTDSQLPMVDYEYAMANVPDNKSSVIKVTRRQSHEEYVGCSIVTPM
ncbi:aquaporin-9 isoform X2 [Daphnia magna]|uniref:aquaporin-9 isoform X2 n=1 Tax=Daphnia magna TaxID=35525 RepID=UPI001E1BB9FA|nr:aquaporin-9 isoform X2 [Daphnia magna]XP_045028789.1 aquaporin-9 isoform X2 [Daphnia magna]